MTNVPGQPVEVHFGKIGRRRGLLYRLRRLVVGLLALAMLAQVIYVFTPVGDIAAGWLNVVEEAHPADFIVCLGGRDQRLIWAADYYRNGIAPRVIVSNFPHAVDRMREVIERCGVPADRILTDSDSRCTADHPRCIAALPGVDPAAQRFVIVTDTLHTRRAAACFRHGGYRHFQVCSGRTAASFAEPSSGQSWRQRFHEMSDVVYEYAGLLQYWMQGRI